MYFSAIFNTLTERLWSEKRGVTAGMALGEKGGKGNQVSIDSIDLGQERILSCLGLYLASHADVLRGSSRVPGQERVTNP